MKDSEKQMLIEYFNTHSKVLEEKGLTQEDNERLEEIKKTIKLEHDEIMEKAEEIIKAKM